MTLKQLRAATFVPVYRYGDDRKGFEVFASDAVPGLAVVHDRVPGQKKVRISYRVAGKSTDSPSQAVRLLNQVERAI